MIKKEQVKEELTRDLSFASAVASLGMLLRDSKFKGDSSFDLVAELAKKGRGEDENGYRSEFIKIAELAHLLQQGQSGR